MENVIKLPLEKAYNVRELGGYYNQSQQVTQWHRFLRSDDISELSQKDICFLMNYGVNTVIDLRSESERQIQPDALENSEGIDYYHIPFMAGAVTDVTKIVENIDNLDLGIFYIELIKQKELVRKLLTTIADAKEGCILFHCSAGKDRTGVLSMLLLMIAGVDTASIEANYQLTYTYLKEKPGLFDMLPQSRFRECMYSRPETIRQVIDYILEKYQSIETYLISCDISEETILKLKNKLLCP